MYKALKFFLTHSKHSLDIFLTCECLPCKRPELELEMNTCLRSSPCRARDQVGELSALMQGFVEVQGAVRAAEDPNPAWGVVEGVLEGVR